MSTTGLTAEQEAQLQQFISLGNSFTKAYYQAFDTDRASVVGMYNETAVLCFEGATFIGPQAIGQKLVSLPFQTVQHVVTTVDALPLTGGPGGVYGVLVMVVGQLKTDNDQPHGFNETFVLKQIGDSFQICNDMFRLVLHHGV